MQVRKLIELLQRMPQDLEVAVNDDVDGIFYEWIDGVHLYPGDPKYGDKPTVIITALQGD